MRFAVPVTEAKVAAHFGHCTHFALFDVDEATKAIVKKEVIPSPGHQPGFLPAWLAEEGVSVVIAGRCFRCHSYRHGFPSAGSF